MFQLCERVFAWSLGYRGHRTAVLTTYASDIRKEAAGRASKLSNCFMAGWKMTCSHSSYDASLKSNCGPNTSILSAVKSDHARALFVFSNVRLQIKSHWAGPKCVLLCRIFWPNKHSSLAVGKPFLFPLQFLICHCLSARPTAVPMCYIWWVIGEMSLWGFLIEYILCSVGLQYDPQHAGAVGFQCRMMSQLLCVCHS